MSSSPFGFEPETNSFIAFNDGPEPQRLLVGYGFAGRDMIIGDEGRVAWEAAQNKLLRGGNDGTYASIEKSGNVIRIETDYAGHMPIFYYHDGRVAAASNSIVRLVEHLRCVDVDVRPNPAEVLARGADFFPLHQLATFETAVAGVSLLPTGCALRIEAGHCIVEPLRRRARTEYHDDLRAFICTWASRIATLLDSGRFFISVDLSGGLDSRTVFSLFHLVMRDAPPQWMERVKIYSHGFLSPCDPQIAEEVLQASEQALPHGYRWQRSFSVFPTWGLAPVPIGDPVRVWWFKCGGLYSPNYLTSVQPDPAIVLFGGGGGGGFRNFYGKFFPTPALFAASCERRIGPSDHASWLSEHILSTFNRLRRREGDEVEPMILHYREFRGRLHGGLRSRSRISLMPIASELLEVATRSLSVDAIGEGQIFHDIIGNCAAPLVGVRFDQESKSLTPAIAARFVACGGERIRPEAGVVYGESSTRGKDAMRVDGLRQLAEVVETVARHPYVRELWGASAIQEAIDMSASAAAAGRFVHPNPASLVAGILTAGMFD